MLDTCNTDRIAHGETHPTRASPVDGAIDDHSSIWCELSGILGWIVALGRIVSCKAEGNITAGCDIPEILSGIKKWIEPKNTRQMQAGANSDLLRDIRAISKRVSHIKSTG